MVGSADQCSFRALAQSMRSGDESMSDQLPALTAEDAQVGPDVPQSLCCNMFVSEQARCGAMASAYGTVADAAGMPDDELLQTLIAGASVVIQQVAREAPPPDEIG